MCGDFNLPNLSWPDGTPKPGTNRDKLGMITDLKDLTDEYFLFQQIHKPTHKLGNTLDLCYSSNAAFIHSYECDETTMSDHFIINGHTTHNTSCASESYRQPNETDGCNATFDKLNFFSEDINWEKVEAELDNHNWEYEFLNTSPTDMLKYLNKACTEAANKFCILLKTRERKVGSP